MAMAVVSAQELVLAAPSPIHSEYTAMTSSQEWVVKVSIDSATTMTRETANEPISLLRRLRTSR